MKTKTQLLQIARLAPLTTREDAITLCQETTRLSLSRDGLQLRRDERIADVREKFDPSIENIENEIERNVSRLETWSRAHRISEFGKHQTVTLAGCLLEFRKGTGKVVAETDDKASVRAILSLPDANAEQMEELTRVKVELDKDAVKRIAKTVEGAAFLAQLGLRVVVEEDFSFTPAREDLADATITGGATAVAA